jgi:hypothetical protein
MHDSGDQRRENAEACFAVLKIESVQFMERGRAI